MANGWIEGGGLGSGQLSQSFQHPQLNNCSVIAQSQLLPHDTSSRGQIRGRHAVDVDVDISFCRHISISA